MSKNTNDLKLSKYELQQMLQKCTSKNIEIKQFSSKLANEKGENYGSLLYTLEVFVLCTESNKSEILHIMAKTAPPTEYLCTMFNFPITFCKEMNFYKLAISAYKNMEQENGINKNNITDLFPPYYGARTSLLGDEDDEAHSCAILLMGNMRVLNYKTGDRLKGLDLEHTQLAIAKLAEFHALPIALRQKKPEVYSATVLKAAIFQTNPQFNSCVQKQFCEDFIKAYEINNEHLTPYFDTIRNKIIDNYTNYFPVNKNPFATVVHTDLWTNNILFSYTNKSEPGSPTSVKFIDFQGTVICSPVKDIIFFLLSSAQDHIIDNYYDHLIDFYYECFIKKLQQLHCDTIQFSKDKFDEEIALFAPSQFYHIAIMFTVIYAERSHVKELQDITSFDTVMHCWNSLSKHKLERTVKFFEEKGWLK